MTNETFDELRAGVSAGRKGVVRTYLDGRIESCMDSKDVPEGFQPFLDRMARFSWTARKIADKDEMLALDCFENTVDMVEWLLANFKAGLEKLHS